VKEVKEVHALLLEAMLEPIVEHLQRERERERERENEREPAVRLTSWLLVASSSLPLPASSPHTTTSTTSASASAAPPLTPCEDSDSQSAPRRLSFYRRVLQRLLQAGEEEVKSVSGVCVCIYVIYICNMYIHMYNV
jgi:hypothetical protein